jgi:hypothetical protein
MNYSELSPTIPGYYWLKAGETEEVVEVWSDPDKAEQLFFHRCGDGACGALDADLGLLWAGPIPKPLNDSAFGRIQ